MDIDLFPSDLNPDPILVTADPKTMNSAIESTSNFFFITSPLVKKHP
jgi:hypothetical protein